MAAYLIDAATFHTLTSNEFASMEATLIAEVLAAAGSVVGQLWGDLRSQGHAFLTAHMLATLNATGSGGAAGPITNQAIGAISVGYANTIAADAGQLGATKWGQMYLELKKAVIVVPTVDGVLVA